MNFPKIKPLKPLDIALPRLSIIVKDKGQRIVLHSSSANAAIANDTFSSALPLSEDSGYQ